MIQDLLQNYVIISANCNGFALYSSFYPNSDPNFIAYNTPLIAHIFFDDFDFIKFCERYDYYTSLTPVIGQAKTDTVRYQQSGLTHANHEHNNLTYPVLKLEEIDIHLMHDVIEKDVTETCNIIGKNIWNSSTNLLRKWKGRTELGLGTQKIFIWDASTFQTIHSETERQELINRFNQLDGHTIFLTERQSEEFENEKHLIKYLPQWQGKSQMDRNKLDWHLNWGEGNGMTIGIFKQIIEQKIFRNQGSD